MLMKILNRCSFIAILLGLCGLTARNTQAEDLKLIYAEPANKWGEALPVGNGRLGAMIYGGVEQEQIQFNEETLWTGEPHDYSHPGAAAHLNTIRQLLEEGKQDEAEALASETFMSIPLRQKKYQPFGDLILHFPEHEHYTDYHRELDLETAVATTRYQVDGVTFTREVLASFPDQVIAIHLSADKDGALDFNLHLDSIHLRKSVTTDGNQQILEVRVEDGVLIGKALLQVSTDGKILPRYQAIEIENASTATIFLAARTTFVNYQQVTDRPERILRGDSQRLGRLEYGTVKSKHLEDHQQLFNRFSINFDGQSRDSLPTNERIYQFWKDPDDPQLIALYVQYGRYLMITSSRPGGQPANLQGIWNPHLDPPWDSKWTVNINTEMNYWPTEVTNLSECHEPLFKLLEEVSQTGKKVAKAHYHSDGWVLHHNTDIWRGAAPINASNHGIWQTGGAWLCHHFWEHYLFTQDRDFLAQYFPILKGAALFFKETLFRDPETGWLISTPSNSPETGGLVAGPTMDHQIIRSLFRIIVEASAILNTDQDFAKELETMIPEIAPNQIGKLGQLQEWLEDKDDPNNKHRHVSHMWGFHPGKEINRRDTPELVEAAKQSLIFRGDEGTGWSLAWKINLWARFLDGNHAYKMIHDLLSPAEEPARNVRGGSYPNLFDAHPPFQIDGNFGATAGVIEMLLQSHLDGIDILPALPDALPGGSISGVCARGGFELSFRWEGGKLVDLEVLSKAGKTCTLRYGDLEASFPTQAGERFLLDGTLKQRLQAH